MIDINQRPLSFSSLSNFAVSPLHYIKYITQAKTTSPQMALGSLVHTLVLEPSEASKYIVSPKFDLRTKAGKEGKQEFEDANVGKEIIDPDVWQTATEIQESVFSFSKAKSILDNLVEAEKEFKLPIMGMPMRGFIDGLGNMGGGAVYTNPYIAELKTSQTSDPNEVPKDFFNKKYYIQAAVYTLALRELGIVGPNDYPPFMYIVVESKFPYIVTVFQADEKYIEYGIKELTRLLSEFKVWMEAGYPVSGYSKTGTDEIYTLGLPLWIK
jgi:exodeoxyribonuclease VIII